MKIIKFSAIILVAILCCSLLFVYLYPQIWIQYKLKNLNKYFFGCGDYSKLIIKPIQRSIPDIKLNGYLVIHKKISFILPWKVTDTKWINSSEVLKFKEINKGVAIFDPGGINIDNFKENMPDSYKWLTDFYGFKKLKSTYFLYSELINCCPNQITYKLSRKEALTKYALLLSKSSMLKFLCSKVYSFKTKYVVGYHLTHEIDSIDKKRLIDIHFWPKGSDKYYTLCLPNELVNQNIIDGIINSIKIIK